MQITFCTKPNAQMSNMVCFSYVFSNCILKYFKYRSENDNTNFFALHVFDLISQVSIRFGASVIGTGCNFKIKKYNHNDTFNTLLNLFKSIAPCIIKLHFLITIYALSSFSIQASNPNHVISFSPSFESYSHLAKLYPTWCTFHLQ